MTEKQEEHGVPVASSPPRQVMPVPLSPRTGPGSPFRSSTGRMMMPPPPPPGSPPPGGRLRSQSMDNHHHFPSNIGSPIHARSVPVSPVTGKPYSSGMAGGSTMPPTPFLLGAAVAPLPPEPSERQKAMEAAVAAERLRAKGLEPDELKLGADELRAVLKQERRRTAKICADLAALKLAAVEWQSAAEVVEEGRINTLMRRLDHLQQEKGKIIVELEREEEMLTNTLQKQLNEVRREKAQLQQQIDREKKSNSTLSSHLNNLQESNSNNGMRDRQLPPITKGGNNSMGQVLEEEEEEEEEPHLQEDLFANAPEDLTADP